MARFLDSLPPDLTRDEKDLRSAVLGLARTVGKCLGTDGPQGAPLTHLQDWIDRRMPGEVNFYVNPQGKIVISSRPKPPGAKGGGKDTRTCQEFLDSLPIGDFLPEELALRDAILGRIPLGPIGLTMRELVDACRKEMRFLPQSVTLGDWINFRIGGEVKKSEDRSGQLMVTIIEADGGFGGKGHGKAPPRDFGRAPLPERQPKTEEEKEILKEQRAQQVEDFFASLPGDALTEVEQRLRAGLFDFIAGWSSKDAPHISRACGHPDIRAAREQLLPRAVGVKEWVERRIGGEIEMDLDPRDGNPGFMRVTPGGQHALNEARQRLGAGRGIPALDKSEKGKGKGGKTSVNDIPIGGKGKDKGKADGKGKPDLTPEEEAARLTKAEAAEEAKEEFFAALPGDELTVAEQEMRTLLLHFVEGRPLAQATLSKVGSDAKLSAAKRNLLPAGSSVSVRAWIDRRIGGEIETVQDDSLGSKEIWIGKVGEISVEEIRRSLDEVGGPGVKKKGGGGGGPPPAGGGGGKKSKGGGGGGKGGAKGGIPAVKRKADAMPALGKFAKRARR